MNTRWTDNPDVSKTATRVEDATEYKPIAACRAKPRGGAGRKRVYAEDNRPAHVSLLLPAVVNAAVRRCTREQGLPISGFLRDSVIEALVKKGYLDASVLTKAV